MTTTTAGAIACPHCGAANAVGAQFCESCGKALPAATRSGPRVVGQNDLASTAAGVALQTDELHTQMKKASGALLAVAIIQTAFGALMYFLMRDAIQRGRVNGPVLLGTIFGIAALFWGLFIWARSNPFPAAIVGLVVYITLWVLDMVVAAVQASHSNAPGAAAASPFNGIVMRLIIIAVLFNAVKAGAKYRQLMRQQGDVA
jgi:hypothetical protein